MVDRARRDCFDLFPSTKVNNMLKKNTHLNDDILPLLHVFKLGSQINNESLTFILSNL